VHMRHRKSASGQQRQRSQQRSVAHQTTWVWWPLTREDLSKTFQPRAQQVRELLAQWRRLKPHRPELCRRMHLPPKRHIHIGR